MVSIQHELISDPQNALTGKASDLAGLGLETPQFIWVQRLDMLSISKILEQLSWLKVVIY